MSRLSGNSKLVVAGGTYVEECVAPPSISLLGSGGRAALALAGLETIELHTFHPDAADILANFGPDAVTYGSAARIRFRYLHPLSKPDVDYDASDQVPAASLTCLRCLRFGCLEGDFVVAANEAVYDPQGGGATYTSNGSSAERLAVVLNEREARGITGLSDPAAAAWALLESDGAEAVVVKRGARGAIVVDRGQARPTALPAFRTTAIGKIGSGDVFSAMFSHYWLTRGLPAAVAAELASRQVADYVATRVLPRPAEPPAMVAAPVRDGYLRIMVVADTETTAGLWLEAEAVEALANLEVTGVDRYFDYAAGGPSTTLAGYDVVLALPRTATGIAVEAARCARALGIPCVGFAEVPDLSDVLTVAGAIVVSDFAASIYSVLWAAV